MSQVSSKPQGECSHSPRGSGATVGYHKKGYPKQEPKKLLRPCKKRNQKTTAGKPATSEARLDRPAHLEQISGLDRGPTPQGLGRGTDSLAHPRPHTARPRTRYRFSDSPEAPRHEASDEHPVTDSLETGSASTPSPPP